MFNLKDIVVCVLVRQGDDVLVDISTLFLSFIKTLEKNGIRVNIGDRLQSENRDMYGVINLSVRLSPAEVWIEVEKIEDDWNHSR